MIPGWLDEIEEDVEMCLGGRAGVSTRELAKSLGLSEGSAVSYICLLASAGRLTIERVSLPRAADRRGDTGGGAAQGVAA